MKIAHKIALLAIVPTLGMTWLSGPTFTIHGTSGVTCGS